MVTSQLYHFTRADFCFHLQNVLLCPQMQQPRDKQEATGQLRRTVVIRTFDVLEAETKEGIGLF